ncbi:hypothetical protein LAZ67_12002458 [Cordylochernes scorpioides]|uniref:Cuticle protein 10.9-like n=1 Tax=Cordylochernes scorpioides TaxID=51811 RepID=A0ABY6L2A3_9ARAC|nr:hypothetical protein LAZ67_12002458 [Cordylochernes scorpioides]
MTMSLWAIRRQSRSSRRNKRTQSSDLPSRTPSTSPPKLLGGHMSRQESADGSGRVVGSYTLQNEDGSRRTVEYVADENGFRATVRTNEPGTKSESPADVVFESTAPEPVLPLLGSGPRHVDHGRLRTAASRMVPMPIRMAAPVHIARRY